MKIEIQSDCSTANSLTDRLGAGQRTKHIDTRYFWIQEQVQDEDLSIKKVLQRRTAKMLERSHSLIQYFHNIASLQDWCSTDHGSHTQNDGDEPMMDLETGLQTRRHEHRPKEESTGKLVAQKQTHVSVDRERRDGCATLLTLNGS